MAPSALFVGDGALVLSQHERERAVEPARPRAHARLLHHHDGQGAGPYQQHRQTARGVARAGRRAGHPRRRRRVSHDSLLPELDHPDASFTPSQEVAINAGHDTMLSDIVARLDGAGKLALLNNNGNFSLSRALCA